MKPFPLLESYKRLSLEFQECEEYTIFHGCLAELTWDRAWYFKTISWPMFSRMFSAETRLLIHFLAQFEKHANGGAPVHFSSAIMTENVPLTQAPDNTVAL